uniref:Uncharacterized protein n=1 Tax=Arion vulgaris TaxID=1028688 RepID=A0A0B6Y1K2_9EUPU
MAFMMIALSHLQWIPVLQFIYTFIVLQPCMFSHIKLKQLLLETRLLNNDFTTSIILS